MNSAYALHDKNKLCQFSYGSGTATTLSRKQSRKKKQDDAERERTERLGNSIRTDLNQYMSNLDRTLNFTFSCKSTSKIWINYRPIF